MNLSLVVNFSWIGKIQLCGKFATKPEFMVFEINFKVFGKYKILIKICGFRDLYSNNLY